MFWNFILRCRLTWLHSVLLMLLKEDQRGLCPVLEAMLPDHSTQIPVSYKGFPPTLANTPSPSDPHVSLNLTLLSFVMNSSETLIVEALGTSMPVLRGEGAGGSAEELGEQAGCGRFGGNTPRANPLNTRRRRITACRTCKVQ